MGRDPVRDAYAARALEYQAALGRIDATHPADRSLVASWAAGLTGPVIDAGCGPGHWTKYLSDLGAHAEGVDTVPEFVALAGARFPDVAFSEGTFFSLGVSDGSVAGVLAWYSLIHLDPADVPVVFEEFARCLRPGGHLLVGFFEGAAVETFPHAVAPAYTWPVDELAGHLLAAGFTVREVQSRTDPGQRPHAAIAAQRLQSSVMGRHPGR
ncbi:SAM-dependent methyltransferase [Arthrobacter sp. UYP6]|uniref:class I SAM-dependent DNA methyltransferase n=1 Tax=Arthrobacter sp. UYP6 TaxID=1756378 RepID=UPI00339128AB